MNIYLKFLVVVLNAIMLYLAIDWYKNDPSQNEPLIAAIGQVITIIALLSERALSRITTKRVKNRSKVKVNVKSGDNVSTEDIDDSDIQVNTK
jgi:hypothetical protein